MAISVVNADTIRALLDTDLTPYCTPATLRELLAGVAGAFDDTTASIAALQRDVHQSKASKTVRGPIADSLEVLRRLPPDVQHQLFTVYATDIVDGARARASDAATKVAACASAVNGARHHASSALTSDDPTQWKAALETIASLPPQTMTVDIPDALDVFTQAQWFTDITSDDLDDLFDE